MSLLLLLCARGESSLQELALQHNYHVFAIIGGLKGDVQVLSGRVKGKTLLPLPPEAEKSPIIGVDDIMDIE